MHADARWHHDAHDDAPRSEPAPTAPSPPPDATRPYGADPAQVYDVRRPSPGSAEVGATVLVVHGGFWRAAYDRAHAEPEAQAFADAGYTVAVAEYRRVGMPGGGVPGTLDDVHGVVSAVLADPDLPDPLILVGHSAGGHLATWAASQPWTTDGEGGAVAGVVSLAGVVDLGAADRLHLGEDAARAFVGVGPRERCLDDGRPDVRAAAGPVRLLWGEDDDVVPSGSATPISLRRCGRGGRHERGHRRRRPLRPHRPRHPARVRPRPRRCARSLLH